VIAVSGIVARDLGVLGQNALRFLKRRARRMRRPFTLAARKGRSKRIRWGRVYINGHYLTTISWI
jgi:hypothetical protein